MKAMTVVNYAEAQYIVRRKDGGAAWVAIANELRAAPIEFHPADRRLANAAADFKSRHNVSLADAFAQGAQNRLGHRRPGIQAAGKGNQNRLAEIKDEKSVGFFHPTPPLMNSSLQATDFQTLTKHRIRWNNFPMALLEGVPKVFTNAWYETNFVDTGGFSPGLG
jgi:hypothetical protein